MMGDKHEKSPITISIRDGGLECEVTLCAGFEPESNGEDLVVNELREHDIEITQDVLTRISELLKLHGADSCIPHSLIVAEGSAPEHGEHGRLEFLPKFDPDHASGGASQPPDTSDDLLQESEVGATGVDFYNCSAFVLAEAGERIGTLYMPGQGVDGRSVTGETFDARQGKPVIPNVDDSVVIRESGAIESAISGVVQIEGRKIRVLQKLDIQDCVDFSTGNIDFPGDVVVARSVKDGFRVCATRDVQIHGLVEAAAIDAGRDLRLFGGAACRGKGTLGAERNIEARYLNECDLKAGRDLIVEKEILHAHITVGANLCSPNCTLIGGTAYVTGACEFAEIGSALNIPTMLTIGKERDADQLSDRAGSLLQTIGDRIRKSQMQRSQFVENTTKLTPIQTEQVNDLDSEIGAYNKLEQSLIGAVEGLNTAVGEVAMVSLTVQKQIWRGVTIVLGDWEATLGEPIKGPFKITCNRTGIPILTDLLSGSSVELSTVARVRSRIEDEGADEAIAA